MDQCGIWWEEKASGSVWTEFMTQGLESWYTPGTGHSICIVGLAGWKQTASNGLSKQIQKKKKGICQIDLRYQVPGDVLICLSNETTSAKAATIKVHTWLSSWIHCHSLGSICLLHSPNSTTECGYGSNCHPCIFQVLDSRINLCHLSKNAVWLLVYTV